MANVKRLHEQREEIIRCGRDPVYFTNKYLKISHPERGLIKFATYPFQDKCLRDFADHRLNVVLKSRQLGLSTITAAFALWRGIFYRQKNILVIATKQSTAMNFIRKVRTMIDNLPEQVLVPKITSYSKSCIEFDNGSVIKAIPTSDDAGRSESLSLLIVDECAYIRNFSELWRGLCPTVSTGGSAIILSTPNGTGNQYHQIWVDAENKISEFNPIRLPWDVHHEHDQEWFKKESSNLGSRKKVSQELLCDFVSSGDTFLEPDDMDKMRAQVRNPIECWGPARAVWVWAYPVIDHRYVLSADVARGDAFDYSTIQVFDTDTSEQVCEFKGKIPPDQFGILINEIGLKFNKALVCPENNTFGFSTITKLKELGYPNLHVNDRRFRFAIDVPVGKIGFLTSGDKMGGGSRAGILTKLEEYIRTGRVKFYSSRLVDELRTFIWIGNTPKAQRGFNDDAVMAAAIGCSLFDPGSDLSRSVQPVHRAMLGAFGINQRLPPPSPIIVAGQPALGLASRDPRIDLMRPGQLPPEFEWLYR